jgi:hypothetical protein
MAGKKVDFSDLGAVPVQASAAPVDFSDLGGQPVQSADSDVQPVAQLRQAETGVKVGFLI